MRGRTSSAWIRGAAVSTKPIPHYVRLDDSLESAFLRCLGEFLAVVLLNAVGLFVAIGVCMFLFDWVKRHA